MAAVLRGVGILNHRSLTWKATRPGSLKVLPSTSFFANKQGKFSPLPETVHILKADFP
jgi:hypothetical protein